MEWETGREAVQHCPACKFSSAIKRGCGRSELFRLMAASTLVRSSEPSPRPFNRHCGWIEPSTAAPPLHVIGVRLLTDDVLIATPRNGPSGRADYSWCRWAQTTQPRTQLGGQVVLQPVDRRVFAEHVIPSSAACMASRMPRVGAGDGVARRSMMGMEDDPYEG